MSVVESPPSLFDEIADFIASGPTPQEILEFRPSAAVQDRARELLAKLKQDTLSREDEQELDQYEQAELLMRLVKAKLRSPGGT
jgi:hypothetical protein